jgi:D-alanyl-D-alanine carboxypeptidase/D-alanyl-D-alanine-endopeptidase (penicillin-binding protein 4)
MERRPGSPVVVLTCIAITGTMVLLVLWQWLVAGQVRDPEPVVAASPPPAEWSLGTPILSYRRAPGVLAWQVNATSFAAALQPTAAQIDAASCLSVSVDGRPVATVNPAQPVIPASNLKIVTAAVALDVLGPNYTFTTTVAGEVGPDGVVAGDLALIGGGDPVLTTDTWLQQGAQTYPPINVTRLEDLADRVVAAGVTRVDGTVIGDASRYDDEWFIPSWSPDLRGAEAGPYDALLVDDAELRADLDPVLHAATVFTQLLRDRGVTVGQGAGVGVAGFATEVASITSQPLSAIVAEMLQTSDDNTAEMLMKEIGLEFSGVGTTAGGVSAVFDRLAAWGVPATGAAIVDGSGLSRSNVVTCSLLLGVLAHGSPGDALGAGLPVAATSGTLTELFIDTPMAGRLQGKTGTLSDVKTLSGYVVATDGSVIEFSLLQNSPGIDDGGYRVVWEQILAPALATYPSGPSEADLAPRARVG